MPRLGGASLCFYAYQVRRFLKKERQYDTCFPRASVNFIPLRGKCH